MYEIDATPHAIQLFQANQRGNSAQISENRMAKNVSDPYETPGAIRATYKLIVAVDIGTTYTKVAWCQTKLADPKSYLFIDGQWEDQRQVPTAVLYKLPVELQHRSPHWEFHSFGHEAIHNYTKGRLKENESWALFRKFKVELHKKKVGSTTMVTVSASCDCRLPVSNTGTHSAVRYHIMVYSYMI